MVKQILLTGSGAMDTDIGLEKCLQGCTHKFGAVASVFEGLEDLVLVLGTKGFHGDAKLHGC